MRRRFSLIRVTFADRKGAFYSNFSSKEEVFLELLETHAARTANARACPVSCRLPTRTTGCASRSRTATSDRFAAVCGLRLKMSAIRASCR